MKRKKGLVILLAMVLIIGSSFSTGFAQSGVKTIQGWFDNNIKLYNNGVQVNLQNTPIIHQKEGAAGGTTYVAIRELGELLDKTVTWDQASYSAYIVDKPGQNYQSMLMELIEKQEKIVTLEAKVAELEKEVKELKEAKEEKVTDLTDLEKYLNTRNGYYEGLSFDIRLSGTTKNMTVKIYEMSNSRYDVRNLRDSEIKKYLENIVADIERDFKNAGIEGYIEDVRGREVANFYVTSRGSLVIDEDYRYDDDIYDYYLRDLEDDLLYRYGKYKDVYFDIKVSGTTDNIRIDLDVKKVDWNWLGVSDQNYLLGDIKSYSLGEFPYAWVNIYVYDRNELLYDYLDYNY